MSANYIWLSALALVSAFFWGCKTSQSNLLVYPPFLTGESIAVSTISKETVTDEMLRGIVERHRKLKPLDLEAVLQDSGVETRLESRVIESGLIEVRMGSESYARVLSGECTIRLKCTREGRRFVRQVDLRRMREDPGFTKYERKVMDGCDSLCLVGGWKRSE